MLVPVHIVKKGASDARGCMPSQLLDQGLASSALLTFEAG